RTLTITSILGGAVQPPALFRDDEGTGHRGRVDVAVEVVTAGRQRTDLVRGRTRPGHRVRRSGGSAQAFRGRRVREDLDVVRDPGVLVGEVDGERGIRGGGQAARVE